MYNIDHWRDWVSEHRADLEEEFLKEIPLEDQPLDDDIPDFLDNNFEEFEEFCKQAYANRIEG